jgi:hypothetical protein
MKPIENTIVLKPIMENTCIRINGVVMEIGLDVVALDNHMVVIKVQVCKNTIEDALLIGGFKINIITKQLCNKLGFPKPKFTPYNLRMVDQTNTKH